MTTSILSSARKSYLSSLKDPQATSALLLELLAQAEMQTPDILVEFQPGIDKGTLDLDPINWNTEYFSRHLLLAEHNFARERIEHLIKVREHLRELGVKGFVPLKPSPATQRKDARSMKSNYSPSPNLQRFLKEGNLLTMRTALRMELNDSSLTTTDLHSALAWVKANFPGIFDAYEEKAFARGMELDQKLWTTQYYDSQVTFLKTNFCEERFRHLIDIRDLLRRQGADGFAASPAKRESHVSSSHTARQQGQRTDASHSSPERNSAFKAALLIGGAVAALVVFLVSLVK